MRTGIATFTLDHGKCPPWLFRRMTKLGREMTRVIVAEFGSDAFLERVADPPFGFNPSEPSLPLTGMRQALQRIYQRLETL